MALGKSTLQSSPSGSPTEESREEGKMVKIVEVEEVDAQVDECYEIDAADFVSKVNLKSSHSDDDVVILASKGQIKVEVEQLEDAAKTLNCHDTKEMCKSVDADDNLPEYAAADCLANPCNKIDQDLFRKIVQDGALHKEKSDDDRYCVKCVRDHDEAVPAKPHVVKGEPRDNNGVQEDDDLQEFRAFDEEDDEDVVVVRKEEL